MGGWDVQVRAKFKMAGVGEALLTRPLVESAYHQKSATAKS